MDPPAAPTGDHVSIDLDVSPGIINFQGRQRRTELLKIACDVAAVARRYNEAHGALFGFTLRRFLVTLHRDKAIRFSQLESELESIRSDAGRAEQALTRDGLDDLPRHAKITIAFRDALKAYSRAVSEAAQQLRSICHSLESERRGRPECSGYSEGRFKRDRAAYDSAVQEFKRWGARLTELSRKF